MMRMLIARCIGLMTLKGLFQPKLSYCYMILSAGQLHLASQWFGQQAAIIWVFPEQERMSRDLLSLNWFHRMRGQNASRGKSLRNKKQNKTKQNEKQQEKGDKITWNIGPWYFWVIPGWCFCPRRIHYLYAYTSRSQHSSADCTKIHTQRVPPQIQPLPITQVKSHPWELQNEFWLTCMGTKSHLQTETYQWILGVTDLSVTQFSVVFWS